MFEVLVSATFAHAFRKLPRDDQRRIRAGLEKLRQDPRTPRPGADLKELAGTAHSKYRLRVGSYRVVYAVQGKTVKVLDVFQRGRGYRE